jgi:hypothetical protein
MPEDVGSETVDVLLEFPREPALPYACDAGYRHDVRPLVLCGRVKEFFGQVHFPASTDEGALELSRAQGPAARRHDAYRAPQLNPITPAPDLVRSGELVRDGGFAKMKVRGRGVPLWLETQVAIERPAPTG